MKMSENSREQDLLPMELPESMSLRVGSRAKTLAVLGNRAGYQPAEVGSGQRSLDCLAKYDPISQSLKTLQTCWLEMGGGGLQPFSVTWPRSGLMQNGIVLERPTLAWPMAVIGSGYLPTPMASDGEAWLKVSKSDPRTSIARAINRGGQIRFGYFPMWNGYSPTETARLSEMIMGFPKDWTALKDAATP